MNRDISCDDVAVLSDARRMALSGEARALRIAADLSLDEVAAAVGVSRQAVATWETGGRRPRGQNARRYGAVLYELRERAAKAGATR